MELANYSRVIHLMKYGKTACLMPGVPAEWPANHVWAGEDNIDAVNCPKCLAGKAAEVEETFTIAPDGKSITCKRCKMTSYSPSDIEHHYCGRCKADHDNIWPPARKWWVEHPD